MEVYATLRELGSVAASEGRSGHAQREPVEVGVPDRVQRVVPGGHVRRQGSRWYSKL